MGRHRSPGGVPELPVDLFGPAGRLDALLRPMASSVPPSAATLLCHPNPPQGGTMHNKILYRIAKRLPLEVGVPTLRFDFRGTGDSEGSHDFGRGEVQDVVAALDWLGSEYPTSPLFLVGYSFGAVVGWQAGLADDRVTHLVALGLPLAGDWNLESVTAGDKPRCLVHGEHDEFGDAQRLAAFVTELEGPVESVVVPGANHLFQGLEDEAVDAVLRYISRAVLNP